jgi:hypothetical protein
MMCFWLTFLFALRTTRGPFYFPYTNRILKFPMCSAAQWSWGSYIFSEWKIKIKWFSKLITRHVVHHFLLNVFRSTFLFSYLCVSRSRSRLAASSGARCRAIRFRHAVHVRSPYFSTRHSGASLAPPQRLHVGSCFAGMKFSTRQHPATGQRYIPSCCGNSDSSCGTRRLGRDLRLECVGVKSISVDRWIGQCISSSWNNDTSICLH